MQYSGISSGFNQIVGVIKTVTKTQSSTVIALLIKISAEALQNCCSTSLITTRELERGFGMTAQGQVREGGRWRKKWRGYPGRRKKRKSKEMKDQGWRRSRGHTGANRDGKNQTEVSKQVE